MQDPSLYLNELGILLAAHDDTSKQIAADTVNTVVVNYETFVFSNRAARINFANNPVPACGPLTDPVSLQRFIPASISPRTTYDGRQYIFWSDSTKAVFEMMPDMYAKPHHKMRPKPDAGPDSTQA